MAITNFLPTMWAAAILERFNQANVLIPGLNAEYEGILAAGNTVKITSVNTPTIRPATGWIWTRSTPTTVARSSPTPLPRIHSGCRRSVAWAAGC